jgi:hypothetical protein
VHGTSLDRPLAAHAGSTAVRYQMVTPACRDGILQMPRPERASDKHMRIIPIAATAPP